MMRTPSDRSKPPSLKGKLAARHTGQRGALAWWVAPLMLFIMIPFTLVTLDAGRLWLERRNLQNAADIAALESSRFTGCGSSELDASNAATRAMNANAPSLSPGGPATGTVTLAVMQRGQISTDVNHLPLFVPIVGASDVTNATHVKLSKTVPASILAGGLSDATTTITAEAMAKGGPPVATFSIGSFASISQQQANLLSAIFAGILGNSSLNLTTNALTSLAQSTISLAELQAAAGAQSIEALLNMQVTPQTLLQWISQSTTMSQAAKDTLAQIISVSVSSGLKIRIGDVLNVQVPATSGVAQVRLNVLDLVTTSLVVGQGSNLINLGLGIAGIGSVQLGFLNPPAIAVGPAGKSSTGQWCTEARSTQLQMVIGINPLGIGLVDMALRVNLASTNGHLESLHIAAGNTTGSISAGSTLADLQLTSTKDATQPATVLGGLISVGLNLPLFEGNGGTAPFTVTSVQDLPETIKTSGVAGSSIAGLIGADTSLTIKVLGIGGNLLAPLVKTIISPILGIIGYDIIDPLFSLLGIDLGLVKVSLNDIKSPQLVLRQ